MIARFEFVTKNEEACKELCELCQTGRVARYIAKLEESQSQLLGMADEEAFSTYLVGLDSHLHEQMGAHVRGMWRNSLP